MGNEEGLLLLIGLFTRPVAFILSGEMAFAYFIAHAPKDSLPLLNGGELDGVRLLSPRTLAVMTSDQVPPAASRVAHCLPARGGRRRRAADGGAGRGRSSATGRLSRSWLTGTVA